VSPLVLVAAAFALGVTLATVLRRRNALRVAILALAFGVLAVALVAGVATAPRGGQTIATPQGVLDMERVGDELYLTLGSGQIASLDLAADDPELRILADGLEYPRGLAIGDGRLYVAELGPLPCDEPFPYCKGPQVGPTVVEGERTLIEAASARLLSYPIQDDGTLGELEVVADGLPYVNTDHGVNDVELGPDGGLYVAIGGLDALWAEPREAEALRPDSDRLGTILRVDPTDGSILIHAAGFRNVYGLAFDEQDRLFGVDNDGETIGGWRQDELIMVEQGLDYGYPDEGTFGPFSRRTGFAMWSFPLSGPAGIASDDAGLYVGSCGALDYAPLETDALGFHVDWRNALRRVAEVNGCVTAVVIGGGGQVWAAILAGDDSRLEVFPPAR
jgi:hypothetical protein